MTAQDFQNGYTALKDFLPHLDPPAARTSGNASRRSDDTPLLKYIID